MSDSEGTKELSAIARSVDALFSPPSDVYAESGVDTPPEPPNVAGDPLTGAPVLPDAPEPSSPETPVKPPSVPAAEAGPEAPRADAGPPPVPEADGGPPPVPEADAGPPPIPEADAGPPPTSQADAGPPLSPEDDPGPPPLPEPHTEPPTGAVPPPLSDVEDEGPAQLPTAEPSPPPLPEVAEPEALPGPEPSEAETTAAAPEAEDLEEGFVPTRLDLAVDAHVEGDRGKAGEIESIAEEMLDDRELDPVARAVGRLAIAAGDPPDGAVLELARSIATPFVYSRLARQIGSEHDEARRQEYFLACRNLGEPMGVAIRDDLAESTDRHSRRIHCEALVEMGAAGRRIIEEMAVDENRFLVRNAVAILGDIGGEGAVELVTSALANPDARVRREALRSLAKLGDEESGELVLGLLEDSDPEVRIAAAVAAGELHVERALRFIIKMLDETKDPDEAIPLIRALGHLGDPGAVPSIEKHAVPRLFSKPRTDVRIVAYRALNEFGTPRARRLLNQAMDDKDPEVKAAVKEILGIR